MCLCPYYNCWGHILGATVNSQASLMEGVQCCLVVCMYQRWQQGLLYIFRDCCSSGRLQRLPFLFPEDAQSRCQLLWQRLTSFSEIPSFPCPARCAQSGSEVAACLVECKPTLKNLFMQLLLLLSLLPLAWWSLCEYFILNHSILFFFCWIKTCSDPLLLSREERTGRDHPICILSRTFLPFLAHSFFTLLLQVDFWPGTFDLLVIWPAEAVSWF